MNYTIVGAGKSGVAAALLAKELGENVFLTETTSEEQSLEAAQTLAAQGIEAEFGGHSERGFRADCFVVSPGIPPHAPFLKQAEERGIPIISELEFAWRQLDSARNPVIAITGTNGKTTTTALTAHILNQSGKKAVACGNIGTPLSALVLGMESGVILVVEASSYQLDRTDTFCPDVAVILNITPDHLSYHGSFVEYCRAKWKISRNQTEKNVLVLCADNPETQIETALDKFRTAHNDFFIPRSQIQHFSVQAPQHGAYARDGIIVLRDDSGAEHKEEQLMMIDELRIPGVHNVYNSMAAALSARAFEVRNENIRDSLLGFMGVEHRLEFVRHLNGVDYVNDSKATNVNSTWYALSSYTKPIVWIAGGRGDNNDYSELDALVRKNVRCVVCIGEEADALFNHFSAITRCIKAPSLEQAVAYTAEQAGADSVALFSPACKSFDMFANYEHRGEVFKEIVNSL